MRLDKYLKVSRLIKRRTVANEACSMGRVSVNDKVAKPATDVKVGDVISVRYGSKLLTAEILVVKETVRKEEADLMYRIISDTLNDKNSDEE
ncbi:MAG: RNA-binding S4 domain-containing protein [Clostridia bacterium]|nr:RNA-binding S4 domain-containing protein [Clostridia bacterium]